jgi:hypothetical protein
MGWSPLLASRFRAGLEEASFIRIPAGGFILTKFSDSVWRDSYSPAMSPALLEE